MLGILTHNLSRYVDFLGFPMYGITEYINSFISFFLIIIACIYIFTLIALAKISNSVEPK